MSHKKRNRFQMKTLFVWPLRIVILGACGLASVFLLASAYESLYNRSLPLVHTLDGINLQAVSRTYDLQKAFTFAKDPADESIYGKFGLPTSIKLSGRTKKLDITPAIHPTGNEWLARANALHLLTPEAERSGNIGIALLYCRSSFRTIDASNTPTEGGNLFMDTDHDWRYVYKVVSVTTVPDTQSYVPADNGSNAKLLIVCNDSSKHTNTVIEANLLTVQGVES
jgi:hypothetical protein